MARASGLQLLDK